MRLENKTAIVTGGASGFGAGIAQRFAREGASVVIADINNPEGESIARGIRDSGDNAVYIHADVTSRHDTKKMISTSIFLRARFLKTALQQVLLWPWLWFRHSLKLRCVMILQ